MKNKKMRHTTQLLKGGNNIECKTNLEGIKKIWDTQ